MLGETRIKRGKSPYDHENEAIDFVIRTLPNSEPYFLWALTELFDPSSQRLYELDAIILGYAALYVVEIKSHPGIIAGDRLDWRWTDPEGRVHLIDSPIAGINHKAKVLASRLRARLPVSQVPWVQPLVFLSAPELKVELRDEARLTVVTRASFERAITHHEFPGADERRQSRRIDKPAQVAILKALREMGFRERVGDLTAGSYRLGRLLDQGVGWRDYEAQHKELKNQRRRARVYLVSSATSTERRAQLRRAADREAQLLSDASGHESVLHYVDFIHDAPAGPTILFEDFDGGQTLESYLRTHPSLTFIDKVGLIDQVAQALEFCHRRGILHGGVNPDAVLVRDGVGAGVGASASAGAGAGAGAGMGGRRELRLCNFQLGGSDEASVTRHISSLTSENASLFQAPELRDGSGALCAASDVFSLGALSYFVFTGDKPAADRAELDERLRADHCLDPRRVGDDVPAALADLIRTATALSIADRLDAAADFRDTLLDLATGPIEPDATADPLTATKGHRLEGGFDVLDVLGLGATARVLLVRFKEHEYALKVSLDASHDARLAAEARVLARLNHPRIVQLEKSVRQPLTVGGRKALLMSVVGNETLYKKLLRDGTVPLDYALRFGEDLFDALAYLEDEGLFHRDIKPANLGVGAPKGRKEANHLNLFDFSLAEVPPQQIEAGTAAYRDPFLRRRGAWDAAADLWSAAVTLHELLTGVRPSWGGGQHHPDDEQAKLVLRPESFDPSLRGSLEEFFSRALARDVSKRFASAAEMRRAWVGCFAVERPKSSAGRPPLGADDDAGHVPDEVIRAIKPETPVGALPLSVRAINALDRAGLVQAADLLNLPDNRLSAIRGVGHGVAKEVLDLRRRWTEAVKPATGVAVEVLASGYHGPDAPLSDLTLPATSLDALSEAGIFTARVLAATDVRQLAQLGQRHSFPVKALREALAIFERDADERDHPRTLEGWLVALLPAGNKAFGYARLVFGLDDPFAGRQDVTGAEVAKHAGKTAAAVYLAVQRCRDKWREHPGMGELRAIAHELVQEAGGAVRLGRAAERLLAAIPHDETAKPEQRVAQASALLRIVAEIEEDEGGLTLGRLGDNVPWLCADPTLLDVLRPLGKAADDLCTRYPPAPSGEVQQALAELVRDTPLAALGPDRLTELAVEASKKAARSSRLEIYERDLDPARAIKLTASVLGGGRLDVEEVRRRVRQRYPEAAKLPDRPALDELLEPEGFVWNDIRRTYERVHGAAGPDTSYSSISRQVTALPSEALAMTPAALEARAFDERLRTALDRGRFCALKVLADQTSAAVAALARVLEVKPLALDRALLDEAKAIAREASFDADVLFATDADGERGEDWAMLRQVMEQAAERVAARLLPNREAPLLLVQPGLAARFGLDDFLGKLVRAAREEKTRAILLVVPCHDSAGLPLINKKLSIPELQASQAFFVPRSWIENQHKRAA